MTPDDYTLGALHCSFTDKGAYTDAITNVSSLGAPLSVIDTEPLLRPGKLPKSLVLDFVHEATHQWCFHSTVGNAITYLAGRTSCPIYFKNPVLAEEINLQPDTWDVDDDGLDFPELGLFREDMIRVETATGILRPLAEGLAMFAELDATTNPDSDYAPMPLLSLPMSFGDFESVADLDDPQMISTKLIRDVLHSSRLSPDGLDRRMRLLTQPFEHRAGGYLPGYLAIKQLWVSVGLRDSSDLHNADSGLFLGYARSFFYDDYGLVNVLLNPATEDVDSYLAISEYLKNRVLVFLDNVTDQDIRAYERNVLPDEFGHVDPLTRARYIHTGEQEYQAGRRLLEKAYSWLDGQDGGELENKARLVVRDVMSQRDHMYIGNARGFMKVDEEGVRVGDASGTLTIPKLSFSPPKLGQSGPCRITIFYFTSDGYHRRIIGLSQENENWAGAHIPRLANGELEIEDDLLDKLAAYPALTLSRQLLSSAIRHAKFIAAAYGFWDESLYTDQIIRPAVLKAYWGFALANFKLGYSPELEDRLRKTGIGFLFDWNRELIEGAALAGLCAASGLSVEELPSTFASYELDLLATMEGLEVMRQKYGIPLAFLVDDVYIISL